MIHSSISNKINGGAEEDRTPDLLRARQALSQLSYGPMVTSTSDVYLSVLRKITRRLGDVTVP